MLLVRSLLLVVYLPFLTSSSASSNSGAEFEEDFIHRWDPLVVVALQLGQLSWSRWWLWWSSSTSNSGAEFEVDFIHRWEFDTRGEILWLGGADSYCWDNYTTNITTHTICNIAILTRLNSWIAQLNLWKWVCKTYQILNLTPMTQLMESVELAVCHRDTTLKCGKKHRHLLKQIFQFDLFCIKYQHQD